MDYLRLDPIYTAFMSYAHSYCPEFKIFAGNVHVIPDDNDEGAYIHFISTIPSNEGASYYSTAFIFW